MRATRRLTRTVGLLSAIGLWSAAASADEVVLYSTRGDERVHVLGAQDLSPLGTIDAELGSHELRASPDGRWIVGTAYGGPGQGHQPPDDRVVVIDARTRTVHRIVTLEGSLRPNDIAFADRTHAIITVEQPPGLVRLNVDSGAYTKIALKHGANHMLALSPDGRRAYVAHVSPGALTCIDLENGVTVARVELPQGAEGIACSRDGARVWIACNRSHQVVVVDAERLEVEARIDCRGFPFRVRAAEDGSAIAIACPMSGEVVLYDPSDPSRERRIGLRDLLGEDDTMPVGLAFTRDGKRLAVLCDGPGPQIVLLDVTSATILARGPVAGPLPDAITSATLVAGDPQERP
jgi:DNA-binding beta-propeller fold protein YncE